jgi:hypothetical protein
MSPQPPKRKAAAAAASAGLLGHVFSSTPMVTDFGRLDRQARDTDQMHQNPNVFEEVRSYAEPKALKS